MTVTIPEGPTISYKDLVSVGGSLLEKPIRIYDPTTGNDIGFKLKIRTSRGKKAMFVFMNETGKVYVYEMWEAWFTDEDMEFMKEQDRKLKETGSAQCLMRMGEHGPGIDRPFETREFFVLDGVFTAMLNGVVVDYWIRDKPLEITSHDGQMLKNDSKLLMHIRYDLALDTVNIGIDGSE